MSVEARDAQALQDFRRGLDQLSDREDGVANNSVTQVLLRGMSDGDCLRFVRARKYDVQKALLMADKWSKVQALIVIVIFVVVVVVVPSCVLLIVVITLLVVVSGM